MFREDLARGVTLRLSRLEAEGLDTLYQGVLDMNSVNRWAYDQEGQPYWFVNQAFKAALQDLFGEHLAKEIHEAVISDGDAPSRIITNHFHGEIMEVEA